MEREGQKPNRESELDKRADQLVDTRQLSYTEAYDIARHELGLEGNAEEPSEAPMLPPQYHGGRYGPQYSEEAGVGYKDGVPPEWQPYQPLSDKQVEINRVGAERVRRAQEEARLAIEEAERKRRDEEYPDTRSSAPW